jgi:hypothetical protein
VAAGFHPSSHVSKKKRAVSGRLTNVLQTGETQRRRSPLMNPGFVQKKRNCGGLNRPERRKGTEMAGCNVLCVFVS